MVFPPRRTHVTTLTDDDLILMDALFDKDLTFAQLQRKDFGLLHNTRWIHRFTNRALRAQIAAWLDQGLLHQHEDWYPGDAAETRYGLTSEGGALWESERTPIWSLYATMSWTMADAEGTPTPLSVFSPTKRAGRAYLEWICESSYCKEALTTVRPYRCRSFDYIPYKRFPYIIEWRTNAADRSDLFMTDGAGYEVREAKRIWWSSVGELQRFLPAQPVHE